MSGRGYYNWWLSTLSDRRISVPKALVDLLPLKEFTLYYDLDKTAIKFGPPLSDVTTYHSKPSHPGRNDGEFIEIAITRKGLPMPSGAYVPAEHNVFVHEAQLPVSLVPARSIEAARAKANTRRPMGSFSWTPYRRDSKVNFNRHAIAYPAVFYVTGTIWREMGRPRRVNIYIDPMQDIITVRPDPDGAHSMSAKHAKYPEGGHQCTINKLGNSTKLGNYEPVEVGRFEAIFKHSGLTP